MKRLIFLLLLPSVAFGQATSGLPAPSVSGPLVGPFQDKGGAVFNVTAYGAKADARILTATTVGSSASVTITSGNLLASDTGKTFVINSGSPGVGSATYTSGATATGAAGSMCSVTFGAGGATGFLELSATNTIAASTSIMITAFGSGYSSGSQSATLSNGTARSFVNPAATCSGTITVNVTALYYPPQITTITFVDSTHGTMGVAATSSVTSGNAAVGTNNDSAITSALSALNTAGAGTLLFPQGAYLSSACGFTVPSTTSLRGAGMTIINGSNHVGAGASTLYCPSNTASFFTFTADTGTISDIGLINISGLPTAGAAITATSSANAQQAIVLERVDIENWFDGFDTTTTGNSKLLHSAVSNYVRYGVLIDNTLNVDAGGFIIDGNNFVSVGQTWIYGSSTFWQNGAGGGHIINNNSSGISNRVEHGYVGTDNLVNTVQLMIANNNWDQVGGSILVGGHMMPDVVIRNNQMISNQTVYGAMIPITFNVLQTFEIGGGYITTLCTPSCPANDILIGTASNGMINPFYSNGTTGVVVNFGGTATDNSGQNPTSFPVNGIVPYSGTSVTITAPNLTQNQTAAGSTLTVQSSLNSSSGGANIFLNGGNNAAFIGTLYEVGGTDYWREGFSGFSGSTNWKLRDDQGGKDIITLPNNTMPASSISGNSSGPILLVVQVPAARKGTFVCTGGGTIAISNANFTTTSDVIITMNTASGTITTPPAFKTVTNLSGFSVLCGATDTSTYNYDILN